MSDSAQNDISKQINELFLQAEEEEHNYNWNKEIGILKKIEKISLDNKIKEIEGEIYYKLGEIYQIAADFEKTEENVLKRYQLSISSFENAYNIFKELQIEEKINVSLGFINLLKYISGSEAGKEEFLLESAKDYLKKARIIYQDKGNLLDSLKIGILESRALNLLISEKAIRLDESIDFMELSYEYEKLMTNIWKEIKNQQNFPEIYLNYFIISTWEFIQWFLHYLPAEDSRNRQLIIKYQKRTEEFLEIFEGSTKKLCIFTAYSLCAWLSTIFPLYFVFNQFEQKKYLKYSEKWLKKGENLLSQNNINSALCLFYYMRFTNAIFLIYLGFFAKNFRHAMEDLSICIDLMSLTFPKIIIAHATYYAASIFIIASLNRSTPDIQRIDFAKKTLDLIELISKIPIISNLNYKTYDFVKIIELCIPNVVLGDLIKDENERSKYFQLGSRYFSNISESEDIGQKISNIYIYFECLIGLSRAVILLAKNSSKKSKKIYYYNKVIDMLLKGKKRPPAIFQIENLFLIGDIYYELGKLTNDSKIFKESYSSYMDTIEYCKNKGYFNLVGSAYINLAQIEDRLGNFVSAAENYQKAIDSFDQAIITLTYTKLSKKIEKLKNYMKAWNLIEIAKSYHNKEDHGNAQLNYEQASIILKNIREYYFESPFYSAWAVLENAENLSKNNKHQEAAATYLVSKNKFKEASEILNSFLSKKKTPEDINRISKLIQVAQIRETYCTARHQIETAKLESKIGNHLIAAELYNKSGSLFENLCQTFRIKWEKDELMAIFYLCKAWENMERAEVEEKPSLYAQASELFEKASETFPESRMKKLSLGNSLYCSALECGSLFDNSTELEDKINYYKKIKLCLRESSKNYQIGGFEQDAQWALATSTFFDGIWQLIQADNEMDLSNKNHYLALATNYLNNALTIFGKAGYKQRREEILKYLKMIRDEKAILTSALNLIEKPAISTSSVGISAPSCPIEISSSVNIEEMQRTDLQTESELNWSKRIQYVYLFMPNGTCIYDHPFKAEYELEPQLVAGGLTGISALIQELTQTKTKVKIVEQEDMTILLEHGKYLSAALMTEENLITLRNKLVKLIKEVEDFYQEELETYSGNIGIFPKVGKFIQKIFEQ